MSKINKVKKHFHFHWIHLFAAFILGCYFILSKANTLNAVVNKDLLNSFVQIYLFGIFFACLFLYIFSHDRFFPVAREIEKRQKEKEKQYLEKYLKHGKILATFLIGMCGGPIFSSLTARILLKNYRFKYVLIVLANIPSTVITVALGKGVVHFL